MMRSSSLSLVVVVVTLAGGGRREAGHDVRRVGEWKEGVVEGVEVAGLDVSFKEVELDGGHEQRLEVGLEDVLFEVLTDEG